MKLYFLLEGEKSEMQAYPSWIKAKLPNIKSYSAREDFSTFSTSNYAAYFLSGLGFPSILNRIEMSVSEIHDIGGVDYFIVVLDSDDYDIPELQKIVDNKILEADLSRNVKTIIVVQKKCFETLVIANDVAIPRNPGPEHEHFLKMHQHYNVYLNDPEDMLSPNEDDTNSQYHAKYAIAALGTRGIRYRKGSIGSVADPQYFNQIIGRIDRTEHMESIHPFLSLLDYIFQEAQKLGYE
ncbi:hypothetical protein J7937_23005 [Vibrio parahaemolyticus]|nr:hypothetical protein [Vibrio parahaemolyticus]